MTEPAQALAIISAAERALMEVEGIVDILDLHTTCKGIEALVRAIDAGYELQQRATIMRIKCERKAGQWLSDNISRGGSMLDRVTLNDLEIARWQSSRWQTFALLDDDRFNGWIDEHLSRGWDVTAAGLLRYAKNVEAKATGSPYKALLLAPPDGTCALAGFSIRCDGSITGGHIIHKGDVQGNAKARAILAACPPEIMSDQCEAHNVGRVANSRPAIRILLLQKIYKHGYPHMAAWWEVFLGTWKVVPHELRLEVLLDVAKPKLRERSQG